MSSLFPQVTKSATAIYRANPDDKRDPDISEIPAQASTLASTTLGSQSIDCSPGDGDHENYPCIAVPSEDPRITQALHPLMDRDAPSRSREDSGMLVSIAPATVDHSISPTSNMSSLSQQAPKLASAIYRANLDDELERDPDISISTQASTTLRPQSIDQPSVAVLSEASRTTPALYSSIDRDARSREDSEMLVSIAPAAVDHSISLTSSMSSMSVSPQSIDQPGIAVLSKATTRADKEAATYMKPPPPPTDTVKGYNKQMDEPRPTRIQDYLRSFEVLFVVDDSGSMAGDRWKETRDALADIAEYAFAFNVHTVSLRFLNNATYVRGLQRKANVLSLFDKVRPNGWTPTGAVLNTVFGQHLGRIDAAVKKGESEYSKILPLDIIVLTDGMPSDRPADVVAQAVKRLRSSHYHPNTMGVQFVQIADEELAKNALRELVMGDNARIVDTVPYRGVVTSQKLQRILLGGLHPNIRKMLPVDMLAI